MGSEALELRHWSRVRVCGLVAIEYVETHQLVAAAAVDGTASLFTLEGSRIGTFGQRRPWELGNPSTYESRAPLSHRTLNERRKIEAEQRAKQAVARRKWSFARSVFRPPAEGELPPPPPPAPGPSVQAGESGGADGQPPTAKPPRRRQGRRRRRRRRTARRAAQAEALLAAESRGARAERAAWGREGKSRSRGRTILKSWAQTLLAARPPRRAVAAAAATAAPPRRGTSPASSGAARRPTGNQRSSAVRCAPSDEEIRLRPGSPRRATPAADAPSMRPVVGHDVGRRGARVGAPASAGARLGQTRRRERQPVGQGLTRGRQPPSESRRRVRDAQDAPGTGR